MVFTKASKEYELDKISERNKTNQGGPKQGNYNEEYSIKVRKSRDKGNSTGESLWKNSITC